MLGNQNAAGVINQYKDIIRDQDHKLQNLQISAKKSHGELERLIQQLTEVKQSNSQLYDQNILLKAQLAAATNGNVTIQNGQSNGNGTASELEFYKSENNRLSEEVKSLNEKLNEALEMTEQSLNLTEIGKMRKDQEDLLELLTDQVNEIFHFRSQRRDRGSNGISLLSFQEAKIKKYQKRLVALGQTVTDDEDSENGDNL